MVAACIMRHGPIPLLARPFLVTASTSAPVVATAYDPVSPAAWFQRLTDTNNRRFPLRAHPISVWESHPPCYFLCWYENWLLRLLFVLLFFILLEHFRFAAIWLLVFLSLIMLVGAEEMNEAYTCNSIQEVSRKAYMHVCIRIWKDTCFIQNQ